MDQEPFLRSRLFCPGPTPTPVAFRTAPLVRTPYHRSEEFYRRFLNCRSLMQEIIHSEVAPLILTCSGTGALEAAVQNLTAEGDEVLVIHCGRFGERWRDICKRYLCTVHTVEAPYGSVPDIGAIKTALIKNPGIKAVFFQGTETSTAVTLPIQTIADVIRQNSSALIIVDAISYLLAHPFDMQAMAVDVVAFASQKAFGLAPGLAFLGLSPKAWQGISKRPRFYFDLNDEQRSQDKGVSIWTPAIDLVISLEVCLERVKAIGTNAIADWHRQAASAVRGAMQALDLELLASDHFAHGVTAVRIPRGIDGKALTRHLREQYAATFAGGQGPLEGKIFRIGHLGFVDRFDLIAGIAALEFTLNDLGRKVAFGTGVGTYMKALR